MTPFLQLGTFLKKYYNYVCIKLFVYISVQIRFNL